MSKIKNYELPISKEKARESILKRRHCSNCAAYDGGDQSGICRIRSPQTGSPWPTRTAADWCMEFVDKELS